MDAFIQFIARCYDVVFSNVGKKLQMLAKIYLGLSIVGSIVGLFATIVESAESLYGGISVGLYFIMAITFIVISFLASWLVYAFGQVIDDIHRMCLASVEDKAVSFDHLPKL